MGLNPHDLNRNVFNYNNQLCDLNTILTEMYFIPLQLVVWLDPHDLNRNVF